MTTSRNKREGVYMGKYFGKHVRGNWRTSFQLVNVNIRKRSSLAAGYELVLRSPITFKGDYETYAITRTDF